jgi:N4-gp56 family major capsid protein
MAYAANYIPEVWSPKVQKIANKTMVMEKIVNTDHEGEIKKAGDTVHVRSYGEITIRNYTREQTLTMDTLTDPMSDLTIDQEKYFAFNVDDVDDVQADINIMNGYVKRAAYSIARTVDQHLHAQYANVDSGNIIGSSSAPATLTKDNIYFYCTELRRLMKDDNADGEMHLVIDPTREALMLNAPEFVRATGLGDRVVQNGEIGTIAGFRVHCSTNLNSSSGNVPILALTRDLISYAGQISKTEMVRPSGQFVDVFKGLYVYGSKIFANSSLTTSAGPDEQGAVLWAAGT